MSKLTAKDVKLAAEEIRKAIDRMERSDHPMARDPVVQKCKELANMGDILADIKAGG